MTSFDDCVAATPMNDSCLDAMSEAETFTPDPTNQAAFPSALMQDLPCLPEAQHEGSRMSPRWP
jgi:hypothetical protein